MGWWLLIGFGEESNGFLHYIYLNIIKNFTHHIFIPLHSIIKWHYQLIFLFVFFFKINKNKGSSKSICYVLYGKMRDASIVYIENPNQTKVSLLKHKSSNKGSLHEDDKKSSSQLK